MEKLVLIGNGMAGVHCIEEIIKKNPQAYEITIFGAENHVNYNRILLSSVLQGSTTIQDITINDQDWYEQHHIQLYKGEAVEKIDTIRKVVQTENMREVAFDKLIIATGSVPFLLPLPGIDKEGVISFRTIEDCEKMIDNSKKYKKAVVIGGGLLGLEAARGLLNLGMRVDVVHIASHLMERQLDSTAAKLLQIELEKQGMNFLLEKETQEIIGEHRVEGLRFKDGTEIQTDLVVMAVGVKPNIQLAKDSGIETNRAIVVNDYLQTSVPNIYAVGECAEHRGMVYGLVKPLYEQGKVLAKHIIGMNGQGYSGSVLSTQLKISGVDVFSMGQFTEDSNRKSIRVYDDLDNAYKKLVLQENKLVGAVLFGNTKEANQLLEMIIKEKDVSDLEKVSLLQSSNGIGNSMASLTNSEIICSCNHVSKGAIIEAVQSNGLATIEEIRKCTKASSSCGGCKPLVADLLSYMKSDEFMEVIETKTMCSCTNFTEDEIVHEILLQSLTSIEEVMEAMEWKNHLGCSTCLPAITYYLEMIYPEEELKQETQFINIKTCIDENLCSCNKQTALDMAAYIKEITESLLTPSRIKIGISACIHNGADSTTKDIGLIRIDRGWEIYVGGSSGWDVQTGKLLCVAETHDEVVQMVLGFIQYYRGTANYLERTWQWIERVGMVHIREVLFDQELCQQLLEQSSLKGMISC